MRTVIVTPWRSDGGGRRAELWKFVRAWIEKHHSWPIVTMDSDPTRPFNRGQAINRGAAEAGRWDVMVVFDADNIANPPMLKQAVHEAGRTGRVTMPYEVYTYLDQHSSNQLMTNGNTMFYSPLVMGPDCCGQHDHWYNHSVLHHHHSGIQVFPRKAFERVGGFIEFDGWGYEDSVMADLLRMYAGGLDWLRGSALHLWHPHAYDAAHSPENLKRWQRLHNTRQPERLRQLLAGYGHIVP